jgi:hypothetical protein
MNQITLLAIGAVICSSVQTGENYDHFPSLEAPNTAVALCNLSTFNAKLVAITQQASISTEDMVKVHELTYTLENAVLRLQKDLDAIAIELENVHKASEQLDASTIKQSGTIYIEAMQKILEPNGCE